MLDQKQIWAFFLFKLKMGCKASQECNNNTIGPGTTNEHTVQNFRKFFKGD